MSISMRVSDDEKKIIQEFAELYGISVSEFIKRAVMEKIEDEYDLKAYESAMKEFNENSVTYSMADIKKELNL